MPRIDLDRAGPPQQTILGEPMPLFCERCAAPIHSQPVEHCRECSLPSATCPQCENHTAVRSVRPVLEQALARVAANTLHMLTFVSVAAFYLALFGWFVFGYETLHGAANLYGKEASQYSVYYRQSMWLECMIAAALAAVFGFLWRLVLLRWRSGLLAGLAAGAITTAAMLAGACYWLLKPYGQDPRGASMFFSYEFQRALLAVAIAVSIGCAIGWPILHLFIQLFTPKTLSTRLLTWRQSGRLAELIAMDDRPPATPTPKATSQRTPVAADVA